ncbi:hypothetical protein M8C21_017035 [Ambrosia artemisiifolia]|uniref:Uncharacterized protein n=1 Tax=Ambrosia artemisiifolia TaxID=4212 RepID=A0AAD5C3Z3_AMBAR|nr:hypothetical protein M8C21_017035 [Ambrosia artemisiifolia]
MPVTGGKSKSRLKRKPLRDVSNANGSKRSLTTTHSLMKKLNPQQQQQSVTTCSDNNPNPLDRLLLVHSDLSVLIHQIDELVVQALEKKVRNEKEIESFANVLHEMQNSLKPWVSRFQNILPARVIGSNSQLETSFASMKITPSINEETSKNLVSPYVDKFDFLVSPSPLVSWRAECAADGGRNLFLLTPLPKRTPFSSRLKKSSKSVFNKIANDVTVGPVGPVADKFNIATNVKTNSTVEMTNDVKVGPVGSVADNINIAINEKTAVEKVFSSPEKVVRMNDSIIVSTPYMKMSPPKSCMFLEPSSEWCNKIKGTIKRPMDPVDGGSGETDPSSSQLPSGHLALKYPELFGIRTSCKMGNSRKVVEASPIWCISPPKTCVILEPSDDDQIKDFESKLKKADGNIPSVVSCKEVIDSTPMCKDLDTTVLKGKRAGENTLKKELWTRFEAATAHGFHSKSSLDKEKGNSSGTNKGFLDLLDEVSLDDTNL